MTQICSEIDEWIEEEIEKKIKSFYVDRIRTCERQDCNWWCLCCNKWFCWFFWGLVSTLLLVLTAITRLVTRVICEFLTLIVNLTSLIFETLFSLPLIGELFKQIWNWITEAFWRLVGLIDFAISLGGGAKFFRKKMYINVIIPKLTTNASQTEVNRQIEALIELFDRLCNIDVVVGDTCYPELPPPRPIEIECGRRGYAQHFGSLGTYLQVVNFTCDPGKSFRRVLGYGAPITVFIVQNVTPDNEDSATSGCSFLSSFDWIFVEARKRQRAYIVAHEVGHTCLLGHYDEPKNLMYHTSPSQDVQLDNFQVSMIRWSKHCVYF